MPRNGPNADVPGYDPVAQAESGLMSMSGERDGEPVRTGSVAGGYGLRNVRSTRRSRRRLCHAQRSGERAASSRPSLHETGLNMLINFAGAHLIAGAEPTRAGNTNQVAQPAGVYVASDGPFMLAIANDGAVRTHVQGRPAVEPDLAEDARFRTKTRCGSRMARRYAPVLE